MATDNAARRAAHLAGQNLSVFENAVQAMDPVQAAVLAADQASSIITGAAVTGFSATLEAGKSYLFEFYVHVSSAATTTGIKFEPVFSGTGTRRYSYFGAGIATALQSQSATTGLVGPGDLPASSVVVAGVVSGSVICTTSGTLTFNMASEVDSSAATLKAGSTMKVTEV